VSSRAGMKPIPRPRRRKGQAEGKDRVARSGDAHGSEAPEKAEVQSADFQAGTRERGRGRGRGRGQGRPKKTRGHKSFPSGANVLLMPEGADVMAEQERSTREELARKSRRKQGNELDSSIWGQKAIVNSAGTQSSASATIRKDKDAEKAFDGNDVEMADVSTKMPKDKDSTPKRKVAKGRKRVESEGELLGSIKDSLSSSSDDGEEEGKGRRLRKKKLSSKAKSATEVFEDMDLEDDDDENEDEVEFMEGEQPRVEHEWSKISELAPEVPMRTSIRLEYVPKTLRRVDESGVLRHFLVDGAAQAKVASQDALDERQMILVQMPPLMPIRADANLNIEAGGIRKAPEISNSQEKDRSNGIPQPPPFQKEGHVKQEPTGVPVPPMNEAVPSQNQKVSVEEQRGSFTDDGLLNSVENVKRGKIGQLHIRKSGKAFIQGVDANATKFVVLPGFNSTCVEDAMVINGSSKELQNHGAIMGRIKVVPDLDDEELFKAKATKKGF